MNDEKKINTINPFFADFVLDPTQLKLIVSDSKISFEKGQVVINTTAEGWNAMIQAHQGDLAYRHAKVTVELKPLDPADPIPTKEQVKEQTKAGVYRRLSYQFRMFFSRRYSLSFSEKVKVFVAACCRAILFYVDEG